MPSAEVPMSYGNSTQAWCEHELVSIREQIQLLSSGKIGTHERHGQTSVDTTPQSIRRLLAKLAALEDLLRTVKHEDAFAQVQNDPQAPQ
jgi:hypothetical protein